MKKSKKLLFISTLIIVILGFVSIFELTNIKTLTGNYTKNLQAYNHSASNILDNVFEKDGLTIIPFIYKNSDENITKKYIVDQFENAGITIKDIQDEIGTGTVIETTNKTYAVLIYGDVDGDGYTDTFDALAIIEHVVFGGNSELRGIYKTAANVDNDDDEVDTFDALKIIEFVVGSESKLVLNEPISIKEMDKEKPVIKLNGANPQIIKLGDKYTELGATVTDNVDKKLEVSIDISNVNINKIGQYKVKYNTKDSSGNVADTVTRTVVVEDFVKEIQVKLPTKTTYKYGENIDLTGATVCEVMASGTLTTPVTLTNDMISGYNKNKLGNQVITLTYKGKTTTFTVTVEDYITSIEMSSLPTKREYTSGEELDLTGAKVKQTMASGASTTAVALTNEMVNGYEKTKIGEQIITVTYKEKTTTFTVTVKAKVDDFVTGIEITKQPTKKEYKYGETIDLSGAKFKTKMNSGDQTVEQNIKNDMISGYNANLLGDQNITVTYTDAVKGDFTATFTVTVVDYISDIKVTGFKTLYKYAQGLDLSTATVSEVMKSGTEGTNVAVTNAMVTGYNPNAIGTQKLTVTYKEIKKEIEVEVSNYITGIEITKNPTKLNYIDEDTIDTTGMIVKALKANGDKTTDITTDIVLVSNKAQSGVTVVTLNYTTTNTIDDISNTFNATFNITVLEKLTNINVIENTEALKYAKEDISIATLKEGLGQRPLVGDEVKYKITTEDGTITSDIVSKTKSIEVPGTPGKYDIVMMINATKVGKYIITPYVGDTFETAIAKGIPLEVEITSNPEVSEIIVDGIDDNELRSGKELNKNISFVNKYNDSIEVEANRIQLLLPPNVNIELLDKDGLDATGTSRQIKSMKITTTLEQTQTVNINIKIEEIQKNIKILIGEKEKVSQIQVLEKIELLSTMPLVPSDLIQEDIDGYIYTLLEVQLISNYNEKVPLTGDKFKGTVIAQDGELSCLDSIYEPSDVNDAPYIVTKGYRKDGESIVEVTGNEEIQYIGIAAADVANIIELKGKEIIFTYGYTDPIVKTIDVEVPYSELEDLIVTEEIGTRYVKENNIIATIKEGLNQTPLEVDKLKFNVETEGSLTPSDIVVSAIVRSTPAREDDIAIQVNATKAGEYKITPYLGNDFTTATIKGSVITVVVTDNPEVGSIELEEIRENELRSDKEELVKEVTFKNIKNDIIEVPANRIIIEPIEGVTIILLDKDQIEIDPTSSKDIKYIKLKTTIEESITKKINIKVDSVEKNVSIKIGAKARVSEIQIADTIELPTSVPTPESNLVKVDDQGNIYLLLEIQLMNNYDEKVILTGDKFIGTSIAKDGELGCLDSIYDSSDENDIPYIVAKGYREEKGIISEEIGDKEIQYIGIGVAGVDNIVDLIGATINLTYGITNPITKTISITNT